MCGIKARNDEEIAIQALCLQSRFDFFNRRTWLMEVFIENESRWKIKSFHCSCKAGSGESCKHCVSVMLFCLNDINELEDLSATDMKYSWNTRKYKHLYTPVPVQDFCHVKTPPEHSFCEVKKRKVREEICEFFKDSAYAKHRARFLEKKELTEM
ncbi:uncharacterized protein LOC118201135 [Stegodyphus dumicola]|uniref:uncharacterized protein LOC118201135 n=1 Tax=Stegodyphus dumicola TaxID=202533 RepID=UPI0015AD539A|nr:uncharacterized protein LOC118201135 [Stegodyphus dumicola]